MSRPIYLIVLSALAAPAIASAQPVVDGKIDALYGVAAARDKAGDAQKQKPIDLLDMYLYSTLTDVYVAFTINEDVTKTATNWGKFLLYIDTTNTAAGATKDAWGRNVVASAPHRPEYSLNGWVNDPAKAYGPAKTELWRWSGSAWAKSGAASQAALLTDGKITTIEWRIPRASLGSPAKIWVEMWSTGNGTTDNAQDTINSPAEDWNATDWKKQAALKVSTPLTLAVPTPDAGARPDATSRFDAGPTPDARTADKGTPDAGVAPDASSAADAGRAVDSKAAGDAGRKGDGKAAVDTGATADGKAAVDTGATADGKAAVDGGAKADRGSIAKPDSGSGGDGSAAADAGSKADGGSTPGLDGRQPKIDQSEGCACATALGAADAPGSLLAVLLLLALAGLRRSRRIAA